MTKIDSRNHLSTLQIVYWNINLKIFFKHIRALCRGIILFIEPPLHLIWFDRWGNRDLISIVFLLRSMTESNFIFLFYVDQGLLQKKKFLWMNRERNDTIHQQQGLFKSHTLKVLLLSDAGSTFTERSCSYNWRHRPLIFQI